MRSDSLVSPKMETLLTAIEEATRSSEEGVKYFVEPAEGSLRRAVSKRHHIVFGRRGSGKSSLLRKAAADLTIDRRPIAWVDLEAFKGHSYPDLLISVLIKTFSEFRSWLLTAAVEPATKTTFWNKLFGTKPSRSPLAKKECNELVGKIGEHLLTLNDQLHLIEEAEVEQLAEKSSGEKSELAGEVTTSLKMPLGAGKTKISGGLSNSDSTTTKVIEKYRRSKVEFLKRHVMDYQAIFKQMGTISNGDSFLFLDDLYHLRRTEQPLVLDYFHAVAKGNHLWLKVGTIRHRSNWYVHGSPPIGMKLGDDADDIDLDLTLEKYDITKKFLMKILQNLSSAAGFASTGQFLTKTGLDRLVLASGGVARDFLAVCRRAVTVARDRGQDSQRGENVGAEDVNVAAGEYDTVKRDEFKRDTATEDESSLDSVFNEVRNFCLTQAESNCFLLDKERRDQKVEAVYELVDLKLLHLVRSRVTISKRQGHIFEAYMLDLSQYAGSRKKRGLDVIEFWRPESEEKLRKVSLILYPRE